MTPSISLAALLRGILVLQGLFPVLTIAAENAPGVTTSPTTMAIIEAPQVLQAAAIDAETSSAQALADRDRFAALIAALEADDAIYGSAASEAYVGYGKALQSLGLHERALEAYGNALQALRVGNGLYDLQQIAVLQQQALAQQTLERWEDFDASRHLIYQLLLKQMPPGTPQRFDALVELARWKFKAGQQNLLSTNADVVEQSADLYRSEIRAMQQQGMWPDKNIQLGLLYLELAAVEYQQARHKYSLPITAFQTTSQPRTFSRVECQSARMPDGRVVQICNNVEQPNMDFYIAPTIKKNQDVTQHLNNMKKAVMSAYEVLQQDSAHPEDRRQLLLEVQKLTGVYNAFNTESIK